MEGLRVGLCDGFVTDVNYLTLPSTSGGGVVVIDSVVHFRPEKIYNYQNRPISGASGWRYGGFHTYFNS